MRHYSFIICLCLFLSSTLSFGQGNGQKKYELSLVGFSMPTTATLNSTIKVSGYIENIGTKPVPPRFLMNFHISNIPGALAQDVLPTFAFTKDSPVLFPGQTVYFESDIVVTETYFTANQRNIVTIWPLMEKNDAPNAERIFVGEIQVTTGFSARQISERNEEKPMIQGKVGIYPNPATDLVFIENKEKNREVSYIIAYDLTGKIVLEQRMNVLSNSTGTLDLSALVLGKYELAFFDSKGKLIRSQKMVKIE